MSNFKKFLALVLATLMVASMMVITAPAASAYAPTGDYAADIALLNSLGVMLGDGTSYQEKENVTRWQMALLIARIVTGETGNAMWEAEKSEYFTDVKADHYPGAIDFCAEMGYIKGVGDNLFDPEANIIYQDALTMLVRLLGYETENTTYPWGYILQARTLGLTSAINTGNKTNLLREEVANLLSVSIHTPLATAGKVIDTDATAEGVQTTNLIVTGLKGQQLGVATLVATPSAAIANKAGATRTGDVKKATFVLGYQKADSVYGAAASEDEEIDAISVKVANITKNADIHLNDYLGFTADLVAVNVGTANETILATMHDVNYYETFTYDVSNSKLIIGDNNYYGKSAVYTTYNTAEGATHNETIVVGAYTALDGLSGKGMAIVCNVGNDDDLKNDIIRYVRYNRASAIYDIELKFGATDLGNTKNTTYSLYFEPVAGYQTEFFTGGVDFLADVPAKNKVTAINASAFAGALLNNTSIANSGSQVRQLTPITSFSTVAYAKASELYTSVLGNLTSGVVHRGATVTIGDVTFITVGSALEFGSGTATLTALKDSKITLGDTDYSVGWVKVTADGTDENGRVNGWYKGFTDANVTAAIKNNLQKEVTYYTVDGAIVAILGATDIATNPNSKAPLIIAIADDGSNVTVNADGTVSVVAFNIDTLKEETVKLGQINGKNPGTLINNFGLGVAAPLLVNGFVVDENTTAADVVAALLKSGNAYAIDTNGMDYVMIAVTNKTDDVYDVSVAANANIDRVVLSTAANDTPAANTTLDIVPLNFRSYTASALSTNQYFAGTFVGFDGEDNELYTFAGANLTVTKDTQYVIFGSNGVVNTKGVLPNATTGSALNLSEAAGAAVLTLSNDKIVIFNANDTVNSIAGYVGTPAVSTTTTNGGWYTLCWTTDYDSMTVSKVGNVTYYNYLFKNMWNLSTKTTEDVVISSTTYYDTPETGFFPGCWVSGNNTPAKKNNAVYKNLYNVWFIGNQPGAGAQKSSIYSWALENEMNVGIIVDVEYGNANKLVIDAVTLTPNGNDGYKVENLVALNEVLGEGATEAQIAEAAAHTDIVVSHSFFVMNQSKGSGSDELKEISYREMGNDAYQGKMLVNGNTGENAELVVYTVDENGVAHVIVNFSDRNSAATTKIIDYKANH